MSGVIEALAAEPILAFFLILALGLLVGRVGIGGVSLGDSGVLFVALGFGMLGVTIPVGLADFGVVLFLYAVGLQAGPQFVRTFRKRVGATLGLTAAALIPSFLTAWLAGRVLGLNAALTAGLFSGALTSTPGLATGLELTGSAEVSIGYGLTYPFGVLGVIVFAQVMPRLLGIDLKEEVRAVASAEKPPDLEAIWLRVANPQLEGLTIQDFGALSLAEVTLSRITQEQQTRVAMAEVVMRVGDHVRVVGRPHQLRRAETVIGPRDADYHDPDSPISSRTLVVTSRDCAGRSLAELALPLRFGVVVTRLTREEFEFIPQARTELEVGDTIRIVGPESACQLAVDYLGREEERLHETPLLPLAFGLLAGILIGLLSWPLPGGSSFALGAAGGPLIAGLSAGYLGRIGPFSFRVPPAARQVIRTIGLLLFLAGAGVQAGSGLPAVLAERGLVLLAWGGAVTLVGLTSAFLVGRLIFRLNLSTTLGSICGAMTSTPGLGTVTSAAESDAPVLAYASVYPVALITVILLTRLLCALIGLPG